MSKGRNFAKAYRRELGTYNARAQRDSDFALGHLGRDQNAPKPLTKAQLRAQAEEAMKSFAGRIKRIST